MRATVVPAAVAGLFAAATAFAQVTQAPSASAPAAAPAKPLILVGCVIADKVSADRFTLSDPKAGVTYRLNGVKLFSYSGRRVRIVGGLYPSPNIAAQGGAMDTAKAAIAAMGATGANSTGVGTPEPVEFQVSQIRTLPGACPPR